MKVELGFGTSVQTVEIPEKNHMGELLPNEMRHSLTGEDAVKAALDAPIGSRRLEDVIREGKAAGRGGRVAIIASDISRPSPSYAIIPAVLDRLYEAGIEREDITVVFALGSHRTQTDEERRHLVGDRVYNEVKCVDSDPEDCVSFGQTEAGTPVDITRVVAEADFRICTGNIEYHYFAGYSGGVKALIPGCATRATIQANHSMMVKEEAHAGRLDGNPVREDLEEGGRRVGIDFIVNVVLDEHKRIVYAVAGDVVEAHRKGCEYLSRMYLKRIPHRADIVLVSQGGAPKDLNLYQTQKALDNAKHAVRDGGVIILVGSCREGLGEGVFERWINEAGSPKDLIDRVGTHFELGGHKAAAIAMVLEHADVYLVSEMDPELVRSCFLMPYSDAQSALNDAFAKCGPDASVLVMPYGGSTLPMAQE